MMQLSHLFKISDTYLAQVIDRSEMNPAPQAFQSLMGVNKSIRLLKQHIHNAFLAKEDVAFYKSIVDLEDESDEAIHHLDNLRRHDRRMYAEVISAGEELLSHYVIAYNLLIEKNLKKRHRDSI